MRRFGTAIWIAILLVIALFLILPTGRALFIGATASHPFLMGFAKFALLSMMGEFLAIRLVTKEWSRPKGFFPKLVVWGVLGLLIVLMFSLYTMGVDGMIERGILFVGGGKGELLRALYISLFMNLTFGPLFMASHRISDTWIESRVAKSPLTISEAVSVVEWPPFIKFVVGKTIPLFWVPAHTVTFLLPQEYQVIFAASLSIILGLILSFAKLSKR